MVRMLCLFCLAAVFIAGTGSPATAACEDYSGLESVYQGAEYTGAFSSVAYLGDGIVVAGKRRWNESAPNVAIYRSTDYGQTWNTVPNPSGITGRHVYFFGQHGSRVFAGTGDEGNVCLMRSDDYGASWSVVLTTAELRTLAGTSSDTAVAAVFSPVYMGGNRWLVSLRNDETAVYFLESLDNGDTWHAFYPAGIDTSARKMILTSDGTLLYAGFIQHNGMYVSYDGGFTFSKTASFNAFAGMADVGDGSYLVGTYAVSVDYYTPPVEISIYKSDDYGQTWDLKKTASLPTGVGYVRTIIKVEDDLIIAYGSCSEFSQSDRCAEAYESTDGGETWTDLGQAFIGPYGNMNAIYDTVLVKPGAFIATAQPDSNILRNVNLPPVAVCQDVTVSADGSCLGAASVDDGSYDPDGCPITLEQSPPGPYGLGETEVELTVTDSLGAADSCTATVTVEDNTPPDLFVPADASAECAGMNGTPVDIGMATATDGCCDEVTITNDAPALFPLGKTTVMWTATDCNGNSTSLPQTVTVVDTTPPEISVALDPDLLWPPNHQMVAVSAQVEVSDICSVPTFVLESISSNEPDDAHGAGDGATVNDIQGADYGTPDVEFLLRAERAGGGDGRIYTASYVATDSSGNSAAASAGALVPRHVTPHMPLKGVEKGQDGIQEFSTSGKPSLEVSTRPRSDEDAKRSTGVRRRERSRAR